MATHFPLFALQSPWAWLLLAAWLIVSDLVAKRWHPWWAAGAVAAAWMATAVTVLPWHLFTGSQEETLVLWGIWAVCSAGIALAARWAFPTTDAQGTSTAPTNTTPGASPPTPGADIAHLPNT